MLRKGGIFCERVALRIRQTSETGNSAAGGRSFVRGVRNVVETVDFLEHVILSTILNSLTDASQDCMQDEHYQQLTFK